MYDITPCTIHYFTASLPTLQFSIDLQQKLYNYVDFSLDI